MLPQGKGTLENTGNERRASVSSLFRDVRTHVHSPWFHVPCQLLVAAFCIHWFWHTPAPNKAVLILGGVAAIMALWEMLPLEKGIYFVLVICLVAVEYRAIDKDRRDFADAETQKRQEQDQQFSAIGATITTNVQKLLDHSDEQFAKNVEGFNQVLGGIGDSIKTETGGDSFAYVTFTPEPNQQFMVAITSHGKYPLRQIQVTMVDQDRQRQAMEEYSKNPAGDFANATQAGDTYYLVPYLRPQSPEGPSGDVQILGNYPFGTEDTKDFVIVFSSLNGYWNERLHLRRVNGTWVQALSLVGPKAYSVLHPFEYFDSGFPDGRGIGKRDWPLVKVPPHTQKKEH
jgi:hypothetical protein